LPRPDGVSCARHVACGRGFSIEVVGNTLAMAAYLYDDSGAATWYLSAVELTSPNSYSGSWQLFSGGQAMGEPYRLLF